MNLNLNYNDKLWSNIWSNVLANWVKIRCSAAWVKFDNVKAWSRITTCTDRRIHGHTDARTDGCTDRKMRGRTVHTGTIKRDRIRIQRYLELHHSHPGSFTCTEYSSDTRDRQLMYTCDRQSLENRVVAQGHTASSLVAGTRTRYPEFSSSRLYYWATAALSNSTTVVIWLNACRKRHKTRTHTHAHKTSSYILTCM